MHPKRNLISILVLLFVVSCTLLAANPNYTNLGFETGTFAGWTGYTWVYSTAVTGSNTSPIQATLPTSRRHVIISDTTAYDANTGNALKKIPKGYKYSARLGDAITNADGGNFRCWEQSLKYKIKVDDTNNLLIMKFACVLQYSSQHDNVTEFEPRFRLTLYDNSGNKINTCTNYDVYSTSNSVKGFKTYTPSGAKDPIKWCDWTTVGADLSAYKNQNITIEFMSADCTGRFHYGYAYFVADYQSMKISTDFCGSSDTAKLTAPSGFESYRWRRMSDNKIVNTDTTQSTLSVPMFSQDSVIYHCIMRSATGCVDSVSTTILKYKPVASFSAKMIGSCTDDNVEFINKSTTNRGTMTYLWDYGDGTSDTISSKVHIHHYSTSGKHTVKLIAFNPPSTCSVDTVKVVESIDTYLVGLKAEKDSICIGSSDGKLVAHGAWYYVWSTDSINTDGSQKLDTASIKIGLRAGSYWIKGYSSTYNCFSDKKYVTITDESDWADSIAGHPFFCKSDSTILYAAVYYLNGAGITKDSLSYFWTKPDGSTSSSDSILVKMQGKCTLLATDKWGCTRSASVMVMERELPLVDMTVTPTTINSKFNAVTCAINPQPDISYQWDYGDSTVIATGSTPLVHYYVGNSITNQFNITLFATDMLTGCVNTSTQKVLMEPFIPNVFTPNSDGQNDYFMPTYDQEILDRNGLLLYKGSEGNPGWDGTSKGRRMTPDTYFYTIHYTDFNNQTRTKKGFITLVR